MARQSKAAARAARRREGAAFRFLAAGAALVILPLVLRASPLGKGFSTIIPFGFLMLAAGGVGSGGNRPGDHGIRARGQRR